MCACNGGRRGGIPEATVPRIERGAGRDLPDDACWSRAALVELSRTEDGGACRQPTAVRVAYDLDALFLRFDCVDRDIWASHAHRDAPLWEEEVVELFIAPGGDDPSEYFEIQVNPLGAIFDARIKNPHGKRDSMTVDRSWSPRGIVASVSRPSPASWRAELAIPWADLCGEGLPRLWRANFFRIERPRGGDDEFSAWSPTMASPPDFHRPSWFGRLVLEETAPRSRGEVRVCAP